MMGRIIKWRISILCRTHEGVLLGNIKQSQCVNRPPPYVHAYLPGHTNGSILRVFRRYRESPVAVHHHPVPCPLTCD